MEIIINVIGQKLKLETSLKNYIAGSQRFIKFIFNLNDEWNGLTTFAQFIQNGTAYNAYLATVDGVANCAYLPPEIQPGECRLLLYGSGGATRATTNYLTLEIDENILVRNASSTEISQPLYDQLVTRFNQAIVGKTFTAQSSSDMTDTTKIYVYVGATTSSLTYGDWYYHNGTQWVSGGQYIAQTFIVGDNLEMVNGELRLIDDVIVNTGLTSYGYVSASTFVSAVQTIFAGETIFIGNPFVPNEIREVITYYKADELPTGNNIKQKTIYCIPNDNGGHDKYIYIPVAGKAEADCWEMLGGIENATADNKGSVQIGDGLNVDDGVVSVNTGTGLDIDNGAVVVDTDVIATKQYADLKADTAEQNAKDYVDRKTGNATKQSKGVMQVGDGLNVNDGTVSVDTNTIATKSSVDTIANKTSILTKDANGNAKFSGGVYANDKELATKEYVDSEVDTAVSDKIAFVEVEQLPTGANIKEKTIYCIPDGDGGHDKYIYIPVNGKAEAECWEQLGGGGGAVVLGVTENNGVVSVEQLPQTGKDGVDYYIPSLNDQDEITAYIHEIWVSDENNQNGGQYFAIKMVGVDEALAAALEAAEYATDAAEAAGSLASSVATRVGTVEDAIDSMEADIGDLQDAQEYYGTGLTYEGGKIYLTHDGNNLGEGIEVSQTGGGGGGDETGSTTFTLTNTTGWFSRTFAGQGACTISATWSSVNDTTGQDNGAAILNVIVNGILRHEEGLDPIANATFSVNVAPYLRVGTNTIQVKVIDAGNRTRTLRFSVNKVVISITSSFNPATVYYGAITFPFTPIGNAEKTVHFILDGTEIQETGKAPLVTSVSDYQLTYTIPRQSHGAHTIECYCTATVNGVAIESEHLYYEFISLTANIATPVIASSFHMTSVEQHTTINIDYLVYDPANSTSSVVITAGGVTYPARTVGRSINTFSYRCSNTGTLVITFSSGGMTKTITITITPSEVASIAATDQLKLFLISAGRSNNEGMSEDNGETGRNSWRYNADGIDVRSVFNNFDFKSDGWQLDKDGISVLRVKGDARLTIQYQPFANDFKSTGKTIELEFATHEVFNLGTTILSCMSGGRGLIVTPEMATIKSSNNELSTQFKEDEHVRISFVVGANTANNEQRRLVIVYINGIASGVIQYEAADNFSQGSPEYITIGSNECAVDLYCIRVYDVALTREQILNNWIADTQDGALMLQRWNRNQIFDEHGEISFSKLPDNLPYMIIRIHELPPTKGSKKTADEVEFVNKLDSTKSFVATGVEMDVQGTSSKDYARKNYDMKFKHGFQIGTSKRQADMYALSDDCLPFDRFVIKADVASSESTNNTGLTCFYNDTTPYKTIEQIANPKVRQGIYGFPIAVFWENNDPNSEDAGKTTFLGKYNFNLPKRAAYPYGYAGILNDEIVKYDENGELNDEEDPAYNPKKMESWEWETNDSELLKFKTDFFDETLKTDPKTGETKEAWKFDFEARFPDDTYFDYTKLHELVKFVYDTYREEATGNALPAPVTYRFDSTATIDDYGSDDSYTVQRIMVSKAMYDITFTKDTPAYRLSRFKAGIGEIMEIDSAIFYYIFTELFLMVDSRCKNMFVGFKGSRITPATNAADNDCPITHAQNITRKAVLEPYDMDTGLGTDNSGKLKYGFSYGLEDTDLVDDEIIFNGQDSVLWCNIRDAFPKEIQLMYQTLRSRSINPFSFDAVEEMYENHQAKWPEAMWNEDAMFKYIWPLTKPDTGQMPDNQYLEKMLGSKAEQRKWWLYNRFGYMDSKWHSGDAISDFITFRARTRGDITVTPFKDMYASVEFGGQLEKTRTTAGVPVTLRNHAALTNNEQIINIYSSSQLMDIGDISGLKVFEFACSKAVNLRRLIVGSNAAGFQNKELNSLDISNNVMLEEIDARNCINLTNLTGLENCTSIKRIFLENTRVTAITTPDGGKISKLHLPGSITTLSIRNQLHLSDFSLAGNSNLQDVSIYGNHTFDSKSIITGATNLVTVHLEDVDWTGGNALDNADLLLAIAGLNPDTYTSYKGANYSYYLSGTVDVNKWTTEERSVIESAFSGNGNPTINWLGTAVSSHTVTFVNYDDTELCQQTIRHGDSAVNPINNPIPTRRISTPQKPAEKLIAYTFGNWAIWNGSTTTGTSLSNITSDVTFKAMFESSPKMCTVRFCHANGNLIEEHRVAAGSAATYNGADLDPVRDGGYTASDNAIWVGFKLRTPGGSEYDDYGDKLSTQVVYSDINATALYLKPSALSDTNISRPSSSVEFVYSDDPNDTGGWTLEEFYTVLCNCTYAKSHLENGQKLQLGDKVKIVLDDNNVLPEADKTIVMVVVGFECYKLGDDSGYARVVFQTKGTLYNAMPMAGVNTSEYMAGWGDASNSFNPTIRTRLNEGFTNSSLVHIPSIYSILPLHWRNMIKTVQIKYSIARTAAGYSPSIGTSYDKLFLPSYMEMGFTVSSSDAAALSIYSQEINSSNGQTLEYYTTNNSRVKGLVNTSYENTSNPYMQRSVYWTRTQHWNDNIRFFAIATDGNASHPDYYNRNQGNDRIAFAFCI